MTAPIEIITYQPAYKDAFRDLNFEWLEKYFEVEPIDKKVLSDPEGYILQPGGHILFARYNNQVVGTCALIRKADKVYEFSKMAVTEKYQGLQLGYLLLKAAIELARQTGAELVFLESNTKLETACNLYKRFGFKVVSPDPNSVYARANIRMEYPLI